MDLHVIKKIATIALAAKIEARIHIAIVQLISKNSQ